MSTIVGDSATSQVNPLSLLLSITPPVPNAHTWSPKSTAVRRFSEVPLSTISQLL